MTMKKSSDNRLNSILSSCTNSTKSRESIQTCWNLYNGVIDRKQYKHVTHSAKGKHAFPARLKNIDKLKTRVNYLEGRLLERPFPVSCILGDAKSIKNKRFDMYKLRLKEVEKAVDANIGRLQKMLADIDLEKQQVEQNIQNIEKAIQQIQQQLEGGEGEEQSEDQQTLNEMQQYLNELVAVKQQADQSKAQLFEQFRIMQNYIGNNIEELNIDLESIKMQKEYSYVDMKEHVAQSRLRNFRKTLFIDDIAKQSFRNGLIDGHEIYLVDFDYSSKRYTFESLPIYNVFYPATTERYIENCPWVNVRDSITAEEVLNTYNITDAKAKEALENQLIFDYGNSVMATTPSGGHVFKQYGGTPIDVSVIQRNRTFFIESKDVVGYESEDGFVVKYKETDPIKHKQDLDKSNGSLYCRSIDVLYEAITIGDPTSPIYQEVRKKKEAVRHPDRPSRVKLPVVGNTFNSITNQPYSLAWNTKELIELNNIVFFTIEKLNNLSGVKGNFMDVSQRPDDMDPETWEYKKKTGTAYIQTKKKGVQGFTYNQFQVFDDTMSDSIAQLFDLARMIDGMFDMITGISRQAMSQITQKDGKGTSEIAIAQSDIIVETIYWSHDQILARALTQLVNLSMMFDNEEDEYIQIQNTFGHEIVKVPKKIFEDSYMDVICEGKPTEESDLKSLKQLALSRIGAEINLEHYASILNTATLREVEQKIKVYSREYQQFQSQMATNEEEAKANMEMQKEQLRQDFLKLQLEVNRSIENVKLALDEKKVNIEEQKLALMQQQIESTERMERYKADQNTAVESMYLKEQGRASRIDEQIRMYEAKANTIISQMKMYNEKDFTLRKMAIDAKKSGNKAKEKIKD